MQSAPFADLVSAEYPVNEDGSIYFNSGCCGRKPLAVLKAVARANEKLNTNPCHFTFNDQSYSEQARAAVARLLDVSRENILLATSTTQALQIIMQSFLLKAGDELVTTDHEHGSLRTIAQYLRETRGIIVRYLHIDSDHSQSLSSESFCRGLLDLVNDRTKIVAISGIISYAGWRPDITILAENLQNIGLPLLVDCAHGPGQILCRPKNYPLWVGSGHKWLGAPNGTAFAYIRSDLRSQLAPVLLGDTYYERRMQDPAALSRLESAGTADVAKLAGLTSAIDLHLSLGSEAVIKYQLDLAKYLRQSLAQKLAPTFRTNDCFEIAPQECTSMLNFRFDGDRLRLKKRAANLQDYLWNEAKIAVQLDYLNSDPGLGMRVSCHVSNTKEEADRLVEALEKIVIK